MVARVAGRGDLGREEARVSGSLVLASTSPQRRAILEQLRLAYTPVAPDYVEHDPPDADPVELVCNHAEGKARSVHGAGAVTLGVDTTVHLDGRVYGKPADPEGARAMLLEFAGRTHLVLSGVCLLGDGFEFVEHEVTRVTFRELSPVEVDAYVGSNEWSGRAGGYAIQGLGARLVAGIEGDYLNVVGLPATLLLDALAQLAPNLLKIAEPS
jgi:septum formation protein